MATCSATESSSLWVHTEDSNPESNTYLLSPKGVHIQNASPEHQQELYSQWERDQFPSKEYLPKEFRLLLNSLNAPLFTQLGYAINTENTTLTVPTLAALNKQWELIRTAHQLPKLPFIEVEGLIQSDRFISLYLKRLVPISEKKLGSHDHPFHVIPIIYRIIEEHFLSQKNPDAFKEYDKKKDYFYSSISDAFAHIQTEYTSGALTKADATTVKLILTSAIDSFNSFPSIQEVEAFIDPDMPLTLPDCVLKNKLWEHFFTKRDPDTTSTNSDTTSTKQKINKIWREKIGAPIVIAQAQPILQLPPQEFLQWAKTAPPKIQQCLLQEFINRSKSV